MELSKYINNSLFAQFNIILLIFIINVSTLYSNEIIGKAIVIDGDTIKIEGKKIRLYGIDSPELKQLCRFKNNVNWYCGMEAKKALLDFIKNNTIKCLGTLKDKYKRIIGTCYLDKQDIQEWMVKHGWAIAYRKYSKKYIDSENFAKFNNLGIWQGNFLEPQKWRKLSK
tara:strand:+ start:97 stop:603 length:507 start_codon:yes stop_codon:yes gene_type:complete